VRLHTQDQLTAIARFFDDVWKATRAQRGDAGVKQVQHAFGLWADAPSEATWEHLTSTVRDLVGEGDAAWMLADLEPYIRK
jgi:hypothetical protein